MGSQQPRAKSGRSAPPGAIRSAAARSRAGASWVLRRSHKTRPSFCKTFIKFCLVIWQGTGWWRLASTPARISVRTPTPPRRSTCGTDRTIQLNSTRSASPLPCGVMGPRRRCPRFEPRHGQLNGHGRADSLRLHHEYNLLAAARCGVNLPLCQRLHERLQTVSKSSCRTTRSRPLSQSRS